jgi:hypothetical protein
MKKSTNKIFPLRKLILHREAIALLTLDQLSNIASGDVTGAICTSIQSKDTKC